MPTARPDHQRRLLDLQARDTTIDRIRHQAAVLRSDPEIAAAQERTTQAQAERETAQTELTAAEEALAAAEGAVEQVATRIARNQQRLDAGTGSSKDLTALQHEIGTLSGRRSELEDEELTVMERVETAQADLDRTTGSAAEATGALGDLTTVRDGRLSELSGEFEREKKARAEVLADIDDAALVSLYEKLRSTHDGVGVAPLQGSRCGGCMLELNPKDLAAIRAAAEDAVVRCEECGRILVRS
ncbi:C4-type zinc ribbon domain-containing protein [Tersicoccus sp. MR15.9]|uniref:zinc ribbon domain-containing protein n=1 Tax=Tersicoccus mangrovi TaxID=3121635 RepID=UPI002FE59712